MIARLSARVLLVLLLGALLSCAAATPVHAQDSAFWVHGQKAGLATLHAVALQRTRPAAATPASRGKKTLAAPTRQQTSPHVKEMSRPPASTAAPQKSIAESLAAGQSTPWAIVTGLTLLTLVPAILLAMTPMVRLLVVFHFLRQALGTQTAPSNQVLMGLGLMMTWFLMQPVLNQVEQQAIAPYRAQQIDGETALERGAEPVRHFMLHYARDKDLELFGSADGGPRMQTREDAPLRVVVPAYMLSELKAGFQIGAILFLPFLLIDLVVASVTVSIGMVQLPPVVISTPVKILLFVMVDGWHLLAGSLLKSFH